jgi:hypothetical protein
VCECEKCGAIKRRKAISIMVAGLDADKVNDAIEASQGIGEKR